LQCVAVCCSVLQCVAVRCSVLQCVAVCCSVLQCVAVCLYLQSADLLDSFHVNDVCDKGCERQHFKRPFAIYQRRLLLQCVAVCYCVLQCVASRYVVYIYTLNGPLPFINDAC